MGQLRLSERESSFLATKRTRSRCFFLLDFPGQRRTSSFQKSPFEKTCKQMSRELDAEGLDQLQFIQSCFFEKIHSSAMSEVRSPISWLGFHNRIEALPLSIWLSDKWDCCLSLYGWFLALLRKVKLGLYKSMVCLMIQGGERVPHIHSFTRTEPVL